MRPSLPQKVQSEASSPHAGHVMYFPTTNLRSRLISGSCSRRATAAMHSGSPNRGRWSIFSACCFVMCLRLDRHRDALVLLTHVRRAVEVGNHGQVVVLQDTSLHENVLKSRPFAIEILPAR